MPTVTYYARAFCLSSMLLAAPGFAQKIGSRINVSTFGETRQSVVAYSSASEYLIVWIRKSSGHDQIRAQRIGNDGSYKGSPIAISTGSQDKASPSIAYVHKTKRWLVAWQEKGGGTWAIRGRSVAPLTGALSAAVELVGGTVDVLEPALAGDRTSLDDEAVLVWRVQNGGIRARAVEVPTMGLPAPKSVQLVTANNVDREPVVSACGGNLRRLVVAWTREKGGSDDIYASALRADGQPLGGAVAVAVSSSDDSRPSIAGDGQRFFVVWQRQATAGRSDVFGRALRRDATSCVRDGSSLAIKAAPGVDEREPAVAYLGGKFAIAFAHDASGTRYDVALRIFDYDARKSCGSEVTVSGIRNRDARPSIASQFAAASQADHAMVSFVSEDPTMSFSPALHAQRFEAVGQGGAVADLGGGCGGGGVLAIRDALVVGNDNFALELSGASPSSSVAIFNVAPPAPPVLSCGGCAISGPVLLFAAPVVSGTTSLSLPIPCDAALGAASVDFQCYVLGTTSSACVALPGYAFSNRLRGQIGN